MNIIYRFIARRLLLKIAEDRDLMRTGHIAIEDELVELRDRRIQIIGRGNGLVIRERDGTPSKIMRLTPEEAIPIALKAIAKHWDNPPPLAAMDAGHIAGYRPMLFGLIPIGPAMTTPGGLRWFISWACRWRQERKA